MAHGNLKERRIRVKELLSGKYCSKVVRQIANEFNCSLSAVYMDVATLKNKSGITLITSIRTKNRVYKRDDYTCQYCAKKGTQNLVIEHVIPFAIGGVGRDYNLVVACHSCNMLKTKRQVWIPLNFSTLQNINKEWAQRILKESVYDARINKRC